ncbi:MAG: hypothetical protein QOI38_2539 [Sphingomonadales bacterium]|jgi:hypothetical protein|nr:hypothetical protein [Sphingomonadales bacterium]
MDDAPRAGTEGPRGCFAALAVGPLTVASVCAVLLLAGGSLDLSEEWAVLAYQAIMASAPFLLLAGSGVTARAPWVVGLAVHILLWGALLLDPILRDGGGANIGLGLIMLLSPVIVGGAALATAKATGSVPDA